MDNQPVQYGSGPIPPRVFMAMQVIHTMHARLNMLGAVTVPNDDGSFQTHCTAEVPTLNPAENACYRAALDTLRVFVIGEDACAAIQLNQGTE
jgi:hypothetical protein